jgi:1,4-alpha-glucan branching enzyme
VVHGKGSLLGRMPGDEWTRFANLRTMYMYMFTHPGTKLLFMGAEFGQSSEWSHDRSLEWHLLQYPSHQGVLSLIRDLNALYKKEPALYEYAFDSRGFDWVDYGDRDSSIVIYLRKGIKREEQLLIVCNFTPAVRHNYRLGVPIRGSWKEIFSSDELKYGGSGVLNHGLLMTRPVKCHNRDYSFTITIPPMGVTLFKLHEEEAEFELAS